MIKKFIRILAVITVIVSAMIMVVVAFWSYRDILKKYRYIEESTEESVTEEIKVVFTDDRWMEIPLKKPPIELRRKPEPPVGELDTTENDLVPPTDYPFNIDNIPNLDERFICYKQYWDEKYNKYVNIDIPEERQRFIYYKCIQWNVPYEIILSIMGVETGFDYKYELSPNGLYYGPGMISIYYTEGYLWNNHKIHLRTRNGAIEAICVVFRDKLDEFDGDVTKALIAYNCGSYGAQKLFNQGKTSTSYSERVFEISDGLFKWYYEVNIK